MKKKTEEKKVSETVSNPIIVSMPNTIPDKMMAVTNLSIAIVELSKAINSINVNVSISNCHIVGSDIGIRIDQLT